MCTCNRLDLQILGSQPVIMPKNLPSQWFEIELVEVHQDCRKITNHFTGIYRILYPNLVKENWRMSTCNRLDLQTLGSQPVIMPQKSPQSVLERDVFGCW